MRTKSYYLVNYKWNDIFSNSGRKLNILLLIGKLFYNYLLIKHIIVKYIFSLNETENSDNDNKRFYKFDSLRKFNFFYETKNLELKCNMIIFTKIWDISKIIKRLHDVDKLRLVIIFNKYLRELFKKISK